MINRADYFQSLFVFDRMNLKFMADPLHTMLHIQAACLEFIFFITDRNGDIL